ncbi:MAG: aminopeptidase P family protein [Cyclobacteriaceae bacterium]|jgi:Xaa-Pro aminopeptidase|nr:aminopeptidase P family protein [Cyclobacteriaceae bacterium]
MNLRLIVVAIICLSNLSLFAQGDLPTDFLSKEFHKERRQKLREKMPANSVAVFFANPVRNRANDVDFIYHQDPEFLYLTGYKEPHAVLLVFKDNQTSANGKSYNEIIFVQPRDAMSEMWTGRRLGDEGTKSLLGLEQSFDNTEFKKYNVDFNKFDQVLFYDFFNDVRDNPADSSDLYSLIEDFKVKVNYESKNNLSVSREQRKNNLNLTALDGYMRALRGVKTEEELEMIRKAVLVSCQGQIEVMKALKPGMSEREIQGVHEFVFKKYQAEDVGYPSIVGAGHNGCILHYIENYKPEVSSKELILMDLGAEYHGYTADITRTIPISGKFSPDQKAIYDIVLKAQEAAMKKVKPGVSFAELNQVTKDVVNKGLKDLGIIKSEDENHLYYPHGCCHHIGLDVHDKGFRNAMQENMTFTIEPGIYIPENSNCDPRWWGIAVRIEDDYRVTKNGYEHLSDYAPRTTEEIEATMKLPSPLDNFILPDLKNKK